jgi:hypothetical protein
VAETAGQLLCVQWMLFMGITVFSFTGYWLGQEKRSLQVFKSVTNHITNRKTTGKLYSALKNNIFK